MFKVTEYRFIWIPPFGRGATFSIVYSITKRAQASAQLGGRANPPPPPHQSASAPRRLRVLANSSCFRVCSKGAGRGYRVFYYCDFQMWMYIGCVYCGVVYINPSSNAVKQVWILYLLIKMDKQFRRFTIVILVQSNHYTLNQLEPEFQWYIYGLFYKCIYTDNYFHLPTILMRKKYKYLSAYHS
jgi:hypothetical protein